MKWFRFYSEVLDDPKVQDLPIAARWHWVEMLCIANGSEPRGRLHADRRLAARCNLTVSRLHALCKQLVSAGLLDQDGEYLVPHGWDKRQKDSDDVATRVRKHRESNVTVTLPEGDREEEKIKILPTTTPDNGAIFRIYEEAFGRGIPNDTVARQLVQAKEEHGRECLIHCFEAAAEAEVPDWRYVKRILERHQREGCDEEADDGHDYGADYQAALTELEERTRTRFPASTLSRGTG